MVRREILPNGLRLLVREVRAAPVVALNLWVGAGSAHDPDDMSGLSHFVEHLLFKSGEEGQAVDVAREVQEAGGYLNAETGPDFTVYHQVVPSERWADVLAAQAAAARSPSFEPDLVEAERAVIIEEARGGESDPSVFVSRRLMELAFRAHAYGRPVVGTVDDLKRVRPGDLRAHHSRNYVSGNIAQVIVGDVDADEAVAAARSRLCAVPSGERHYGPAVRHEPDSGLLAREYTGDIGQPYVAVAFRIPHALHADMPALDALAGLLGSGRSSRLRKELRTSRGLVSDIGAGVLGYAGAGLLAVRAVVATPDVTEVLRAIFIETGRLLSEPPSPSEMGKNLRRLESGYVLAHETADAIAHNIGFFETLGDLSYGEDYVDRLAAVTSEDIVGAARKYLIPERAVVVSYVPGGPHRDARDRSGELEDEFRRASSEPEAVLRESTSSWTPAPFARPDVVREAGPRRSVRATLSGGGTLVAREDSALPIVSAAVAFPGGFADEPEGLWGITYLMQKMAMLGTGSRSADRIADEIEELGTAVSTAVDRDGFGLGLTAVSAHLSDALSVLGDVVSAPAFPSDRLAAVKAEVEAEIREIEDHPMQRALLLLLPLVFARSPYGRPIRGTRDSVRAIGRDDVVSWYRRVCSADRVIACSVGDAPVESAAAAFDAALGRLAPRGNRDDVGGGSATPARPSGDAASEAPHASQSTVMVGFAGPAAGTREAIVARLVCAALSMMGGRLWKALRERPPHAYNVGAIPAAYRLGGAIIAYAAAEPGQEAAATDALLSEASRLAGRGLDADELARAKRHLAGTLEISLMRGAVRASSYAMAELSGSGYEYVERMPRDVRTITGEEVEDVARRYLDPDAGFARAVVRGRTSAD